MSRKAIQDFRAEHLVRVSHPLVVRQEASIRDSDTRAFLASMLQAIKTQLRDLRGLWMAVNGEYPALIVEMVVLQLNATVNLWAGNRGLVIAEISGCFLSRSPQNDSLHKIPSSLLL